MYQQIPAECGEIRACRFCEAASFRALVRELAQMLANVRSGARSEGLAAGEEKMSNPHLMKI
jgi:hypothetical protein